jgi:hypothetical protein
MPIQWPLPPEPAWVTRLNPDPAIRYWELVVEADRPGLDYRASFLLPVYAHSAAERQAAPWRPVRGRIRRHMGLKLALGVLAAVAVGALLWPQGFQQAVEQARWHARAAWLHWRYPALETGVRGGLQLQVVDGVVWGLGQYALLRFEGGGEPVTVFDNRRQLERLGQGGAWSAFHVTEDGRLFIGGWDGRVLAYEGGRWRWLAEPKGPVVRRVFDLMPHRGTLWVGASQGLWRRVAGRWERVPELGRGEVRALRRGPDGALWAVAAGGLWRLEADGWRAVWSARRAGAVQCAQPSGEGWRVGTTAGLLRLADGGTRWLLRGRSVSVLAEAAGHMVFGVWQDGLYAQEGDRMRRLPLYGVAKVSDLRVVDDELWLALYGGGFRRIPVSALFAEAQAAAAGGFLASMRFP